MPPMVTVNLGAADPVSAIVYCSVSCYSNKEVSFRMSVKFTWFEFMYHAYFFVTRIENKIEMGLQGLHFKVYKLSCCELDPRSMHRNARLIYHKT
jgi:hypothetical protein